MASVLKPLTGVRPMSVYDLPEVLRIEAEAYEFGWTEGIFRDCLRVGYGAMVYCRAGVVIGYGIVSAKAEECHILNLCVAKQHTRQGIGRTLLAEMLDFGVRVRAKSAFLEVRPSNHAAIALYLAEGFHQIGRRRGYYPAKIGREDALVFAKELLPAVTQL